MSVTIVLRLSPGEGDHEAQELADLCELVTQDNVEFFGREAASGHHVPCCASCAGVRYVAPTRADYEAGRLRIDGAQALLANLVGACGGIACYDAAAIRFEGDAAEVQIVEQPDLGPSYYHAIVGTPEGSFDPSAAIQAGEGCARCQH